VGLSDRPVRTIHPTTAGEIADALRTAAETGESILPVGGRHHIDKGNPVAQDAELWVTQVDGIVSYDPAEMLAVVRAGTRCGELAAELGRNGQEWPVDAPPEATVGGVIAAGASSFRRLRVGHVRDTVVEMEVVTGDGRLVKSGARTVKNVTGYDVHRLMTGSLGTLGVIVQVALKVRPLPRSRRALRGAGDLDLAARLLEAVPQPGAIVAVPDGITMFAEGWPQEVDEQAAAAARILSMHEIGSHVPGPDLGATTVLEVAVPPSRLPDVVTGARAWLAQAGVGIAWAGADDRAEVNALRARAALAGGIAPAVRGPGGLGDAPIAAIDVQRRLKTAFDPAGVLAPGRGWGGI
jgi:glycolate oxidase FAD binding subunit